MKRGSPATLQQSRGTSASATGPGQSWPCSRLQRGRERLLALVPSALPLTLVCLDSASCQKHTPSAG